MAFDQAVSGLLGLWWSALVWASLLSVAPMPVISRYSRQANVGVLVRLTPKSFTS